MNSQQIGERLRAHRTRAPKVSLAKLAAETRSMTASGISNYEQGIRLLKAREASVLADAFKRLGKPISASELLGIEEKKGQHDASGKGLGALTRHEEAIVEIYRQLPPSGRKRFLDILYAFASACGVNVKRIAA